MTDISPTAQPLDEHLLLAALNAYKKGDFTARLPVTWTGVAGKIADAFNEVLENSERIAADVARVGRIVGKEGKVTQRVPLGPTTGSWVQLIEGMNELIDDLVWPTSEMTRVITAVANGDLSQTMAVETNGQPIQGQFLQTARTVNTMVDQLNSFAGEVTRVAREVGTEGKLGGQAEVKGVGGTWKDLTDNVNYMASNLTNQVRNIAEVTTAVANGDLSKKITVDARGEILDLKNTVNTMVDQLNSFAGEVTRVAREVGTEGKLGGQAEVKGIGGTWKDLTDNVNFMASNLTNQVRNIAFVTTAVANGDLSKKITVDVRGELLELKNTINTMVDQLNAFASEVTRVAREVGTEGKLGGQANVPGVGGTWKDLTDNVNSMAGNLTGQVRGIARVVTAVANGDLKKTLTLEAKGEIAELAETINSMIDTLATFAEQVTGVAREVGVEGKLGGQASVPGASGTWKDLTDNVNFMAGNLTDQVRNIAFVTTAVANGDLSKKITADAKGEILELKNTINTMVDQLNAFAGEVTRVAREVGTEGKLGGQAEVKGVGGTWKDLTDNVNFMASNLTDQVRNIAFVTTAVANGDLSKKITADAKGEILELKNTINTMVDQLNSFAGEVTRVAREVGTEGRLGGQADVRGVGGTWKDLTDNVNFMASNLTNQVRNIAFVTTAVANGDLSKKITVDVRGELLELKNTINTMVDQLNAFASEVTRVAREVGTEGKLGGQANVPGVGGTWKDLTDNVNSMAGNLTGQVRGIARVVTAVANGDLKKTLTLEAKGEIAELAETINSMIDTLATFAEQVTGVAREVGVEGKLGGQASVPGASGTWKDLTDNVNQLAANLTTQVRAIAEVATAVTAGDLTRSINLDARGELDALKDNINAMIHNLRDTTEKNNEQDWLKTNLAKFTRMLQGQRDLLTVSRLILSELAPLVRANHGVFYTMDEEANVPTLQLQASYAYRERKGLANRFRLGEGLVGQCALEQEPIVLTHVPHDYVQINSGLGAATPSNIVVLPVVFEGETKAVIELASFEMFSATHLAFLEQLTESIGIVLNTIQATMRTETLLTQSQGMAQELQSQQEELRQTNEELEEKARLLADQNREVEHKNREVETARQALEEKAAQLALTSKYKSEFLANMSHELRTPLNSLLLLANQLRDNPERNLSEQQVAYARTIFASGNDLLNLINDILDLSKIESGTVTADTADVPLRAVRESVESTFTHMAADKGVAFALDFDARLPGSLVSDEKRLLQILKNLLSNAFKFTERGEVRLTVTPATSGWSSDHPALSRAPGVIAFRVSDTGIGIAPDKQRVIFEAFQQADGTTSRKYGGTGLGLAISRELARILGGEITLQSTPGTGSTFTLYLPTNGYTETPAPSGSGSRVLPGALPTAATLSPASGAPSALATRPEPRKAAPDVQADLSPASAPTPVADATPILSDDRASIQPGDRTVLIVEDDATFAGILLDLAHERGFMALIASRGEQAITLAQTYRPSAITLDLSLPDTSGWAVLDHLKHDPVTRHIPVHIISGEEATLLGRKLGALDHVTKSGDRAALHQAFENLESFIARRVKNLLVVEDDLTQRENIVDLIGNGDVKTTAVSSGAEALGALATTAFDCIVLDLKLPDMSGFDLITTLQKNPAFRAIPIIVYTAQDLTRQQETQLRKAAKSIILKDVRSPERLLDEVTLFLHRVEANLPEAKRQILEGARQQDPMLRGKRVLVVDDDIRNIFALTAVLERHHMTVFTAENGRDAINMLESTPDIDVILMDVMMPELDGYETTRLIRQNRKFKNLPIISLTAKAMPGDREKSIASGASDYISKPVHSEKLLSLLRVWLYR
ncbi:HAMP domain-containing protein [Deinococcus maricopensis]|uniref:histidine kinase n=1 Tax=Deinococcus maricopensis (strain DSM 21211 / LMG 22137 / NRRL B-23946 / LB-34) TaxID=709986 RepID=E8U9X3_DEIML|nr:HAMP domain-containing protein [Deinococcus maricopensis]ADV67862.1 GAF sensor hybrid histidine kinase [Deinococcus maricopensis DSM 21211]